MAYFLLLILRLFRAALFLFLRLFVRLRNARFQSGRFLFLYKSGSKKGSLSLDISNVSIMAGLLVSLFVGKIQVKVIHLFLYSIQ